MKQSKQKELLEQQMASASAKNPDDYEIKKNKQKGGGKREQRT